MFAYCGNNPVNYSDPSGRFQQKFTPIYEDDEFHYIHDQKDPSIASLPFGRSTVGVNGCPAVASYNAMLDLGEFVSFSDVYNWYVKHLSIVDGYGEYGAFIGTVAKFFLDKGYDVVILLSNQPDDHIAYSQGADACIMLYRYHGNNGNGGHYISYSWTGQEYLARNTVNGTDTFASPWDFGTQSNRYFAYEILIYKREE